MEIIARQQYVGHILKYVGKGMMIALTGQRRVGKSYVLRLLATEIEKKDPEANIIYINKEKRNTTTSETMTTCHYTLTRNSWKPPTITYSLTRCRT